MSKSCNRKRVCKAGEAGEADADCTMGVKKQKNTLEKMVVEGTRRSARRKNFDWKMENILELTPFNIGYSKIDSSTWEEIKKIEEIEEIEEIKIKEIKNINTFVFYHKIPNIYSIANEGIGKNDDDVLKYIVARCNKEKFKYVYFEDSGISILVKGDITNIPELACFNQMTKSLYDHEAEKIEIAAAEAAAAAAAKAVAEDKDKAAAAKAAAKGVAEDKAAAAKGAAKAEAKGASAVAINNIMEIADKQGYENWDSVVSALHTYIGHDDVNDNVKVFINNLHKIIFQFKTVLKTEHDVYTGRTIDLSKLDLFDVDVNGNFLIYDDCINVPEFKLSNALDTLSDMINTMRISGDASASDASDASDASASGGGKNKKKSTKKADKTDKNVKKTPVKPKKTSDKKTPAKKPVKSKKMY